MAAVVASGIGYRVGWWQFPVGLQIAQLAVLGAALALIVSTAGLIQARPGARRRGFVLAILGTLAALPLLAMAIHWEYAAWAYPPINDISTDSADAPVFWDMPNPMDYPEATAELQRAAYADLTPLKLAMPPEQAFTHALEAARDQGWTIVASVPDEGRIEATASSLLYGFIDEVIVRVKATDSGSQVDVRSRSRIGRIDRGVNAKRIRAYLAVLHGYAAQPR